MEITNHEQFRKALAFARQLGGKPKASFLHCLRTINRLKRNAPSGFKLYLGPDFVEHSFSWAIHNGERAWFNGGMILHGYEPTFSVELSNNNEPHWSIHT